MALRLLLVRHGNTFGAEDKVVWVGANTDIPLVPEGHAQAQKAGAMLAEMGAVDAIYAGPLRRTRETAIAIAAATGKDEAEVRVAHELREIDYGTWEGKSNDEIKELYGSEVVDDWQKLSVWPEGFGWAPTEYQILAGWKDFEDSLLREFPEGRVVVVSSNGVFRVVAKLYGVDAAKAKMHTGHLAEIEISAEGFKVKSWNVKPG